MYNGFIMVSMLYTPPPKKKKIYIYIYIAVLMDVSDNFKKIIFGEQKIN